jgi:putative hydrolase of the HAD superfamily
MRSQRNEIRVVLFDVGVVLVELSGLAMLLSWLGHRVTAEQVRTLWLTSPIVRSFETGKMQPAAFAEQMISELSLQVGREEFLTELYIRSQRILPGAVELVRRVPRYYMRATLCNTNALQWPSLIEQRDLIGAFDHHFASHLTGKIKSDEEAFQHVLATLGCEGSET